MFHKATVLSRQNLTQGMIRLTLGGPGLGAFQTTGIGDEYLRLFFPNEWAQQSALSRLLEQTPKQVQSRIFIEVARAEDEQALPAHPGATVTWLHKSGNGNGSVYTVMEALRLGDEVYGKLA
ncbi:hypothetical protein ASD04_14290 [Devosia sp. Root436]|uniref:siderophore-interacting protein n=1 Tax=Devosia sp. Root436 TaxID=1736537 RepID=UPI0006F6E327|nr:SIP domain-containing protein [Devosia sp. Root436]KQX35217.1 hypothetical protein ASD04_14290 [Devosia sp. Root436]